MKILYASCRYDPLDRDAGSGVDFNVYETLKEHSVKLQIIGPFRDKPSPFEMVYRKAHRIFSRKLTAKFSEAYLHYCASEVEKAADQFQPDAIFSHNLIPLVYTRTHFPIIYKSDAILKNMHSQWPTYSKLELVRMLAWEKRAVKKSALVITASQWAKKPLVGFYKIPESRILILPIPSSLPADIIPEKISEKQLGLDEVRLLLVAKDYNLKGVDIAIQVVNLLQNLGIDANLRVVGQPGEDSEHVRFMGLFRKNDPIQLAQYAEQFKWAHLLIHPARYEAAGIVCSEAAAFGVPSITNAAGGLATTVENGVSGEVLPKGSPAEKYVEVIQRYLTAPGEYAALAVRTRKRYEETLNWRSAGDRIVSEIERTLSN
jgi:glycosyltransferase involved in cell wall biosynthesis